MVSLFLRDAIHRCPAAFPLRRGGGILDHTDGFYPSTRPPCQASFSLFFVFTKELRPREVPRGGVTDLIAVTTKPPGFMTECVRIDTRTPSNTRALVEREQKENADTDRPCGAHSSQELCISVVSRAHETNSPNEGNIAAAAGRVQQILPKRADFPKIGRNRPYRWRLRPGFHRVSTIVRLLKCAKKRQIRGFGTPSESVATKGTRRPPRHVRSAVSRGSLDEIASR